MAIRRQFEVNLNLKSLVCLKFSNNSYTLAIASCRKLLLDFPDQLLVCPKAAGIFVVVSH